MIIIIIIKYFLCEIWFLNYKINSNRAFWCIGLVNFSVPVIVFFIVCPGMQQWLSGSGDTDFTLQQPEGSSEQSSGCSPSKTGGRDPVYERGRTTATDWMPNIDWEECGNCITSHGGG